VNGNILDLNGRGRARDGRRTRCRTRGCASLRGETNAKGVVVNDFRLETCGNKLRPKWKSWASKRSRAQCDVTNFASVHRDV